MANLKTSAALIAIRDATYDEGTMTVKAAKLIAAHCGKFVPAPDEGVKPSKARLDYLTRQGEAREMACIGWLAADPVCAKAGDDKAKRFELAEALLAKAAFTSKAKASARRTEAQEKVVVAIRKRWSRGLAAAGHKTGETRGGANNAGKANPASNEEPASEAAKPEAKPVKAKTAQDVRDQLARQVQSVFAYVNANAKVADTTSKSFAEDVMKLARECGILPKAD